MSDDQGEKTEEATPKKKREAREEGRIPRSQELPVAVLLLGTALVLTAVVPKVASQLLAIMGSSLAMAGDPAFSNAGAIQMLKHVGMKAMYAILLITLSMAGIAIAIGAAQARGTLTTKPIMPDFNRINPLKNAKRIFGVQSVIELLKSLVKVVIVGFAINSVLGRETVSQILATAQESPMAMLHVVQHYAVRLLMTAGLAYLGLAVSDYLWQYWQYVKELRMTKDEVKQEHKQSEGDPLLKQRMRAVARSMARRQMYRDVPKADVVIVNPTHRAIALQYDALRAPAPFVLAMGERKVAERIKKIALENGVPVIENKPLAVALIASARVGMMIPPELYLAVAEILAFVIRQRRSRDGAYGYRPISRLVGGNV